MTGMPVAEMITVERMITEEETTAVVMIVVNEDTTVETMTREVASASALWSALQMPRGRALLTERRATT